MFHPELNQIAILNAIHTDGTADGIYISLKDIHRCFIVIIHEQAAEGTQGSYTLKQATAGAGTATGTSEKALLVNSPVYLNQNCFTGATESNVLAAAIATLGVYQLNASQSRTKLLVFDIIPERDMDIANGFDCISVDASDIAVGNASVAFAILIPSRYSALPNVFAD